jgi:hypothetical protein
MSLLRRPMGSKMKERYVSMRRDNGGRCAKAGTTTYAREQV